MRDYVRTGRLPMLLLELPSGRALEISDPMTAILGLDRDTAMRRSAPDFTDDPDRTRASMQLLANGTLDGYRRRVRMPRSDGTSVDVVVGVDACDNRGPDRLAVVTVVPVDRGPVITEPMPTLSWSESSVVGTVNAEGVIDRIVSDDAHLLPKPPHEVLHRPLRNVLHPDDAGVLALLAAHASARGAAVTSRVQLRTRDGSYQPGRLALQPLALSPAQPPQALGFAFALSLEPDADDTAEHPATAVDVGIAGGEPGLWSISERNSRQLQAATAAAHMALITAVMQGPQVEALSDREREIVTRILAGQRVPSIARELYLSQSTIRNHLTGVYRKLGVSSQVELVELLRPTIPRH